LVIKEGSLKYKLNKKDGRARGGLISLREEGKFFD